MTSTQVTLTPRQLLLAEAMNAQNLDAVVASSYETVSYLAGTDIRSQLLLPQRPAFYLQTRDGRHAALVCDLEAPQVLVQQPALPVHEYVEFAQDPGRRLAEVLAGLLDDRAGLRIGVEAGVLPAAVDRELRSHTVVGIDAVLTGVSALKTTREVESVGSLARTLLGCLDTAIAQVGAGGAETDYSRALVGAVAANGILPLFTFFGSGPNTALGHPEADPSPLRPGSLWRVDFGGRGADGIAGDVGRTGVVGEASQAQREIFAAVRAAQDAMVAVAEVGRPASDLFRACRRSFDESGLPWVLPHVGHGIGRGLHEAPMLEPGNDSPLRAGTVLMVEPLAILADRREGYHTEDLILVSEDGPVRLTVPQDELLVIPA